MARRSVPEKARLIPCVESASRRAMLGYAIARAHWGQGIAVEAATAAIAWARAEHDLVEIWASTTSAHVRSRRVLEKLGMTFHRTHEDEVFYRITSEQPE